jgi:hypothetical protein
MESEFIELLKCPISNKLFNTPVFSCSDGITYEDQLCNDENKIVCVALKSFISAFLDEFPQYKQIQYQPIQQSINHSNAKIMVNSIIESSNFENLKKYCNFSLVHISNNTLEKLLTKANEEIIIFFIDNLTNIEEYIEGGKLIHYVCRFCPNNINIIKKITEKCTDMKDYNTLNKWYPLHYLLRYSNNTECITFGINQHIKDGLSLFITNNDGVDIIGFAFKYSSVDIIKYMFTIIDIQKKEFVDNIDTYIEFINTNQNLQDNDEQKEYFIGLLFG